MKLFSKLSEGLRKTSTQLGDGVAAVFTHRKLDGAVIEELEELLIMADMGVKTSAAIAAEIAENRYDKDIAPEEIKALLAAAIARRLKPVEKPWTVEGQTPRVVLVVGVNGNGKTTAIGKLAYQLRQAQKKVLLVAADTFRAAAVEQLAEWAKRSGATFARGAENADPASVAYAGVEKAMKEQADIVLIDTAGRLHTKQGLMAELEKIIKVIGKLIPGAPHQVIQVLDATTGQNAVTQLREFQKTAGVTGIIVTKLDGTAKAGILVALAEEFKLPIHAVGVGEGVEDLQPFEAEFFARALVGDKSAS